MSYFRILSLCFLLVIFMYNLLNNNAFTTSKETSLYFGNSSFASFPKKGMIEWFLKLRASPSLSYSNIWRPLRKIITNPAPPMSKRDMLAIFPKTGSLMMFKKVIAPPIIAKSREKVSKKLYIGAFFLLLNLMIQK